MTMKVVRFLNVALTLAYSLGVQQPAALAVVDRVAPTICGSAKASIKGLSVHILGADVVLRHVDRADIEILSNYGENWSISPEGEIRQAKATECPAGVFTNANGRFIMRGKSIKISGNAAVIDGKEFATKRVDDGDVLPPQKGQMMIGSKGIRVNGRQVVEGPVDPNIPDRPEVLQILVPKTFEGNLKIESDQHLCPGIQADGVTIDYWKGSIKLNGQNGNVSVGSLTSKKLCSISVSGHNNLRLAEVVASNVNASTEGPEASLSITKLESKHAVLKATKSSIVVESGDASGTIDSTNGNVSVPASFKKVPEYKP